MGLARRDAAGEHAAWLEQPYTGHTGGWFLGHPALTHYGHIYEGRTIKGLWGLRSG